MKTYRVIVLPKAIEQLADYASHIAHDAGSQDVASQWVRRVYAKLDKLSYFPHRC